jgi:FdhD protein
MMITRFSNDQSPVEMNDFLATEEPLEIRILFHEGEKQKNRSLSITMRTPGDDEPLAAGFLASEGIIQSVGDISGFEWSGPVTDNQISSNQVTVCLNQHVEVDMSDLQRHFYTTSSCGICGKASLDAVRSKINRPIEDSGFKIKSSKVYQLPELLREQQEVFDQTGGLHAAGLFDREGNFIDLREDVGRHNALDKLLGKQFLNGSTPLSDSIVVVSGRASFELVQKAVAFGVPIMVAVGAPSTLAVELARGFNLTLVGFTSSKKFNVYSSSHRVEV